MKKRSALFATALTVAGVISSVALVAKFYQKPVKSAPIGRIEYDYEKEPFVEPELTKEELMELEKVEAEVLKELEDEQEIEEMIE